MSEAHDDGPLGVRFEDFRGDTVVIHLSGRLDIPGLLALRRVLHRMAVTRPWVILDLAGVPEFDPSAIAVLARIQRGLRRQGAHLALWQLRAQPRRLAEDKRLYRIVDIVRGDLTGWLADRPDPPLHVPSMNLAGAARDVPCRFRSPPRDGCSSTHPY